MNKNRKISIIIILICSVIYTISSIVTYHIFTVNDNKNLENEYELKKEKYDLLLEVKSEVIDEGKGIDAQKIPIDKFTYEVTIDENGSCLNYALKEDKNVCANISLDQNYKIVNETYKPNIPKSFEKYKKQSNLENIYFSFGLCGTMSTFIFCAVCLFVLENIYNRNKNTTSQV